MNPKNAVRQDLITTVPDLASLCREAAETDAIAVDTEFIWENTYYPRLGLIQIGLSNEKCYLVDPAAIGDLSPLGFLLEDAQVVKIFHDAMQDLAILSRATGIIPRNIFDTQLAAAFAELPVSLSLENLTQELLQIPLDKSASRTNWLKRPLSDEQIRYAKDDVRYLRALRVVLLERITNPQVKKWLYQELQRLSSPSGYELFNPQEPYKKVKGHHNLCEEDLRRLIPLAAWREKTAQLENLPRGRIVNNAVMIELAKKNPQKRKHLHSTALTKEQIDFYGGEILEALCNVEAGEPGSQKVIPPKPTYEEKELFESLHKYILLKGDLLGIAPQIIGNNKELRRLIFCFINNIEDDTLRQSSGWRKLFLADFFAE